MDIDLVNAYGLSSATLTLISFFITALSFVLSDLRRSPCPREENRTQPPFVFVRQIPFLENRTDRLLVLIVGNELQPDKIGRRTSNDAVPARNSLRVKAGRRIKAERSRAMIDKIANRRTKFQLSFRRTQMS